MRGVHGRAALARDVFDHLDRTVVPISAQTTRSNSGRPPAGGIQVIDRFLTPATCARILEELEFALWRPSLTYVQQADGQRRDVLTPLRVSRTAQQSWFTTELQATLRGIERRLCTRFGCEPAYLESWQATDYPNGGTFHYHLDSGYWDDHPAGDRILTALIYLTTPVRGGGTHFRAQDVRLQAQTGRMVVWNNLFDDGRANHGMVHSSVPLRQGRKTTLVTWLRQKPFRLPSASRPVPQPQPER